MRGSACEIFCGSVHHRLINNDSLETAGEVVLPVLMGPVINVPQVSASVRGPHILSCFACGSYPLLIPPWTCLRSFWGRVGCLLLNAEAGIDCGWLPH